MGYDGKGVCLPSDTDSGRREAREFCAAARRLGVAVYAERKVDYRRELAIIACAARAPDGGAAAEAAFIAYPLVASEQQKGVCRKVLGPARALGVDPSLERQACSAARRLAFELKLEGAFALELFETRDGRLLVNEIAPRVHNSGHYSQDGCRVSQFENHWRAIQGQPLPPEPSPAFGMLNLLGPPGLSLELPADGLKGSPFRAPAPPVHLHWYAKRSIRPGRKLGHLNAVGSSPGDLDQLSESLERAHSDWIQDLRRVQTANPFPGA
jgi:5-(carboxyamino)imidazole ribonucleotide synthase